MWRKKSLGCKIVGVVGGGKGGGVRARYRLGHSRCCELGESESGFAEVRGRWWMGGGSEAAYRAGVGLARG